MHVKCMCAAGVLRSLATPETKKEIKQKKQRAKRGAYSQQYIRGHKNKQQMYVEIYMENILIKKNENEKKRSCVRVVGGGVDNG